MDIFDMNEMTELLPGIMQMIIILAVVYHIIDLLQPESKQASASDEQKKTDKPTEYIPKHMK
jgi:hypothetical protein